MRRVSAHVTFVAYVPQPGLAPSQGPRRLRYLALLLFPGGDTQAVDLGPAEPIDRAALRLHDALAHPSPSYLRAAQALYALAFRPLEPHLRKARQLFLSPDGQLNLVPFAALHDGRRFLADAFHITYLTSGKDLLARAENRPSSASVVVLADPAFSASPAALPQTEPPTQEPTARSADLEALFSTLRSEAAWAAWSWA